MIRIFQLLVRVALGVTFIYAGGMKLLDTETFTMVIDSYGLVSWGLAKILGYAVPLVEVVSGLMLIAKVRGSVPLVTLQLIFFMGILGYAIYMGFDIDCGCFGPSGGNGETALYTSPQDALIRDCFLLAGSLFLFWDRKNSITRGSIS